MANKVKIAVDVMGGEKSPKKIIDGINIALKDNHEVFFNLYGQENLIKKEVSKNKLLLKNCEIINASDVILDDESPLTGAKKSKNTSKNYFNYLFQIHS